MNNQYHYVGLNRHAENFGRMVQQSIAQAARDNAFLYDMPDTRYLKRLNRYETRNAVVDKSTTPE